MQRATLIGLRACVPLLVFAALGCSGSVVASRTDEDSGGGPGDAGSDGDLDAWTGSVDARPVDAFDEYVDPGCPDAPVPTFDYECDPLAPPPGDCVPDNGCYPYVDSPLEPCGAETYGTSCIPAGSGTQGQGCLAPFDCAAGFVCAVSGAGTMCVRLCSLHDPAACPDGQLCEPLDTPGLGGCL